MLSITLSDSEMTALFRYVGRHRWCTLMRRHIQYILRVSRPGISQDANKLREPARRSATYLAMQHTTGSAALSAGKAILPCCFINSKACAVMEELARSLFTPFGKITIEGCPACTSPRPASCPDNLHAEDAVHNSQYSRII